MKKYGDKYFNDYFLKIFNESGYTQTKLATELGVKIYTFNRWLRKERSVDENVRFIWMQKYVYGQ